MTPPPNNNMALAIIATVMCCLPLGIIAIIKASEVNNLWAQGQVEAAHASAEAAKKWALWSIISAAIIIALAILVYLVIFAVAISATS